MKILRTDLKKRVMHIEEMAHSTSNPNQYYYSRPINNNYPGEFTGVVTGNNSMGIGTESHNGGEIMVEINHSTLNKVAKVIDTNLSAAMNSLATRLTIQTEAEKTTEAAIMKASGNIIDKIVSSNSSSTASASLPSSSSSSSFHPLTTQDNKDKDNKPTATQQDLGHQVVAAVEKQSSIPNEPPKPINKPNDDVLSIYKEFDNVLGKESIEVK